MAGRGSRLRPHTLTVPKPLVPVAGKPIVQRLVEDIAAVCDEPIEEIGFIIGYFGAEVEQHLIEVAESLGAKGHIFHQEEALGTAHAILCAQEIMEGKTIVAFADTLFRADFKLDDSKDGIIWDRDYGSSKPNCQKWDAASKLLNVDNIVVGHTVQNNINSKCDNKIWRVDVGISSIFETYKLQVLEILDDGAPLPKNHFEPIKVLK